MPAYAHSYLLTAIVSPDYVDVTGDGLSDDDYGNYTKFEYEKALSTYGWRMQQANMANFNETENPLKMTIREILFMVRRSCGLSKKSLHAIT